MTLYIRTSIIIPTRNNEGTIFSTLKSVFDEIQANDEVIVVLNGSTDNTETIINQFSNDSRLKIIFSEPGRSRARNSGLHIAGGEFINFLDSDDEFIKGHVSRATNFLDNNPSYFAFADESLICQRDNKTKISIPYTDQINVHDLINTNIFEIASVVFRNRHIVYFLDSLEFNEDHIFWIENLLHKKVYFQKQVGSQKKITGQNTMLNYRSEMIGTRIVISAILQRDYGIIVEPNFFKTSWNIIKFLKCKAHLHQDLRALLYSEYKYQYLFASVLIHLPIFKFLIANRLKNHG
ncbi:glycosyltransferase family 2 protein [Oenococcus sicerae]|uniref:Glycosyltransferase family 2 protein n=1 Tax=Oenococcus sicerae TaxID=2203724 RepID=A0ABX5QKT8_9LACO|nr:glycosyltransferase family 2 protein [Oenococcus sicerae]QAS69330.1 glycosyltransferase family 2 protein [Oenococcus sicerae]